MNERACNVEFWMMSARILIRSFWMGIVLLTIWFLGFILAGGWIYSVHSQWFAITEHDFHVMFYYGMAALKTFILMVFLIPYLAIQWSLAGRHTD